MTTNTSYPKLHHYVPVSYLARFANEKQQIRAHQRITRRSFPVNINSIAAETHFYRLDEGTPEERLTAETTLAGVEGAAKHAIDLILSGTFPPGETNRTNLALYMALQMTRTREARYTLESMFDQFLRFQYSEREIIPGTKGIPENVRIKLTQAGHVSTMMQGAMLMVPWLLAMDWVLLERKRTPFFFTSDHPIVFWQDPSNPNVNLGVGIGTADEVYFPLDRQHALILGNRDFITTLLYDPKQPRQIVSPAGIVQVEQINRFVARDSYEWVFEHPDDDLAAPYVPKEKRVLYYLNDQPVYHD